MAIGAHRAMCSGRSADAVAGGGFGPSEAATLSIVRAPSTTSEAAVEKSEAAALAEEEALLSFWGMTRPAHFLYHPQKGDPKCSKPSPPPTSSSARPSCVFGGGIRGGTAASSKKHLSNGLLAPPCVVVDAFPSGGGPSSPLSLQQQRREAVQSALLSARLRCDEARAVAAGVGLAVSSAAHLLAASDDDDKYSHRGAPLLPHEPSSASSRSQALVPPPPAQSGAGRTCSYPRPHGVRSDDRLTDPAGAGVGCRERKRELPQPTRTPSSDFLFTAAELATIIVPALLTLHRNWVPRSWAEVPTHLTDGDDACDAPESPSPCPADAPSSLLPHRRRRLAVEARLRVLFPLLPLPPPHSPLPAAEAVAGSSAFLTVIPLSLRGAAYTSICRDSFTKDPTSSFTRSVIERSDRRAATARLLVALAAFADDGVIVKPAAVIRPRAPRLSYCAASHQTPRAGGPPQHGTCAEGAYGQAEGHRYQQQKEQTEQQQQQPPPPLPPSAALASALSVYNLGAIDPLDRLYFCRRYPDATGNAFVARPSYAFATSSRATPDVDDECTHPQKQWHATGTDSDTTLPHCVFTGGKWRVLDPLLCDPRRYIVKSRSSGNGNGTAAETNAAANTSTSSATTPTSQGNDDIVTHCRGDGGPQYIQSTTTLRRSPLPPWLRRPFLEANAFLSAAMRLRATAAAAKVPPPAALLPSATTAATHTDASSYEASSCRAGHNSRGSNNFASSPKHVYSHRQRRYEFLRDPLWFSAHALAWLRREAAVEMAGPLLVRRAGPSSSVDTDTDVAHMTKKSKGPSVAVSVGASSFAMKMAGVRSPSVEASALLGAQQRSSCSLGDRCRWQKAARRRGRGRWAEGRRVGKPSGLCRIGAAPPIAARAVGARRSSADSDWRTFCGYSLLRRCMQRL